MEMLKPYCVFLKFGYMRHIFDILRTPNQISATLLRLFQNVWYSSITTPKQNCLLLRTVCFEENSFLQKSELGEQCNLLRLLNLQISAQLNHTGQTKLVQTFMICKTRYCCS